MRSHPSARLCRALLELCWGLSCLDPSGLSTRPSCAALSVELCWACRASTRAVSSFGLIVLRPTRCYSGLVVPWPLAGPPLGQVVPRSTWSCHGPVRALVPGGPCVRPVLPWPSVRLPSALLGGDGFARPARAPITSFARNDLLRARGSRAQFAEATCERRSQRFVSGHHGPWRSRASFLSFFVLSSGTRAATRRHFRRAAWQYAWKTRRVILPTATSAVRAERCRAQIFEPAALYGIKAGALTGAGATAGKKSFLSAAARQFRAAKNAEERESAADRARETAPEGDGAQGSKGGDPLCDLSSSP